MIRTAIKIIASVQSSAHKFANDRSGAIAILFALSAIILVTLVGGAVDYGRWHNAKTKQQYALDNAALAAGRVVQTSGGNATEAIATAQSYYQQTKSNDLLTDAITFTLVDDGRAVLATNTATVRTPFLAVGGFSTLPINITAKVALASGQNNGETVEISMMLDITGSMQGTKIEDLKLAAKDLVNIVIDDTDPNYVRVALAPFSQNVNVGPDHYKKLTGNDPKTSDTTYTCVRERSSGGDRFTDVSPDGSHFDEGPQFFPCRPQATIMPLTGTKSTLKTHIDSFSAQGSTAGHLGTAWAWYLLSPNFNSVWSGPSAAKPYAQPKNKKIAVLMTDGEYNTEYSGGSSTSQARELCTNMKAQGITVYSVAFQLAAGTELETTMRQCASSPTHFFNSSTGEELRQTFREIALQITTLRLTN